MKDNQAWQGAATAFQAAANTPPATQEDEARPLPSNGVSRCYTPEDYPQVVSVHDFPLMFKVPMEPSVPVHASSCRSPRLQASI